MTKKSEQIIFNIKDKGKGEIDGIWTLTDNSIFAVLEVAPIPFFDLKEEKQNELKKKINEELWMKLDFPIEIVIRPVNCAADKKMAILESVLGYNIEKTNKTKLIQYFHSFMNWFKEYAAKNVRDANKYYIVVNYNSPYDAVQKDKNTAVSILRSRINFLIKSLKASGITEIKIMSTFDIEQIYNSFLKFHVYSENKYMFPDDWINLFKKRGENERH